MTKWRISSFAQETRSQYLTNGRSTF